MRIHTNRTLTAAAVFLFPILENTGGLLFVLTVHTEYCEYFTDWRPRQIVSTSTLPPLNTHPVWSPILDCDVIFSSSSHVLPDILTTTFCTSLHLYSITDLSHQAKSSQAPPWTWTPPTTRTTWTSSPSPNLRMKGRTTSLSKSRIKEETLSGRKLSTTYYYNTIQRQHILNITSPQFQDKEEDPLQEVDDFLLQQEATGLQCCQIHVRQIS